MGYCIAETIKKFTKKLAVYAGSAFLFLGVLSYNDWISINWRKIDRDLLSLMFRGVDKAAGFVAYFQRLFTHVIPLAGGFYLGFHYSLKQAFQ